jgi:hypothetical protein
MVNGGLLPVTPLQNNNVVAVDYLFIKAAAFDFF